MMSMFTAMIPGSAFLSLPKTLFIITSNLMYYISSLTLRSSMLRTSLFPFSVILIPNFMFFILIQVVSAIEPEDGVFDCGSLPTLKLRKLICLMLEQEIKKSIFLRSLIIIGGITSLPKKKIDVKTSPVPKAKYFTHQG